MDLIRPTAVDPSQNIHSTLDEPVRRAARAGARARGQGGRKAGRKAATNEEVHEHLFGTKPAGELHAALADVKVTAKCFVEMGEEELDVSRRMRRASGGIVMIHVSCVHV